MKTEERKRRFLKALREARGIISTACEATRISRAAYYKWLSEDPAFKEEAESIEAGQIDKVESRLLDRIDEGDTTAIIFYLKAKGKRRGWNEKYDLVSDMAEPIKVRAVPGPEMAGKKEDVLDKYPLPELSVDELAWLVEDYAKGVISGKEKGAGPEEAIKVLEKAIADIKEAAQ